MEISLHGKKALVGGSSKGIGRAVAEQLAASGASVTLMARSEKLLKTLVEALPTEKGQKHGYLVVDFNDFERYKNRIHAFLREQPVDILVNNTQGPPAGGALEKTMADYQMAFDLLFKCAAYTTTLALEHMQKNAWGRIINIASISVQEPLSYLVLSNSIRAALVTWAKTLSIEVAHHNITVNNTLTGYFDTERIAQLNHKKAEKMGISPTEVRKAMEASVPMQRIGDPKEYGALVAFLASEQASYITGTSIPIDGGLLKSL